MNCPHETHVVDAATHDTWTPSLRAHVESCEACAAAAGAAPFMARLAGLEVGPLVLPDPALLWVRARLPSPAAAGRVGRPVQLIEVLGYLVVASGWMGLLASKWRALRGWTASLVPAGGETPFAATALPLMVVLLSALVVALALHAVLADEG